MEGFDWLGLMRGITEFHVKFAGEGADSPKASQSQDGDDLSGNSNSTTLSVERNEEPT
jgi:hypothetical protein